MSRLLRPGVRERLTGDRLVVGVIGVLTAALAVTVLTLVLRTSGGPGDTSGEEAEALATARRSAVSMTSYDHATLDRDFAWVDTAATQSFAQGYRAANEPLRGVITDLEATARGSVSAAAATAVGPGEVTVVMFVDQQISNASDGSTRSDESRVVMSMVERDGRWLVDDVELR